MSTERPEFPPIETAPARRTWPWAIAGAAIVVALVWAFRRAPAQPEVRPSALAAAPAASAPATPAAAKGVEPVKAALTPALKVPESPNVIGNAVQAAKSVAMVAKAELDRELQRTKSAQAQAATYKKQIDSLQKELNAARAQIAAIQMAQRPPPPSDQEQILQTLAPVLKASNGGQP